MAKVFAQIVIDLELDEESSSGTLLDLAGLSGAIKAYLQNMPMHGKQMRVLSAETSTKEWQILSQLKLKESFGFDITDELAAKDLFDELESVRFATKSAAQTIVDWLVTHVTTYGYVAVSDFKTACGIRTDFRDTKFGWRNLINAKIYFVELDDKWRIYLPKPERLK